MLVIKEGFSWEVVILVHSPAKEFPLALGITVNNLGKAYNKLVTQVSFQRIFLQLSLTPFISPNGLREHCHEQGLSYGQ